VGGDPQELEDQVRLALKQAFRPEFLNRVDDTIIFRSLSRDDLRQIVGIQIERLQAVLADKGITLEVTAEAAARLADEGYDPAFGARPLKRTLQRRIEDPLALDLLEGRFSSGDTVRVSVLNDEIALEQAETAAITENPVGQPA
jgi:ATP-dependent Clp protease ATP-binding subunit ClpB